MDNQLHWSNDPEKAKIAILAHNDFGLFVREIFSASFDNWHEGDLIDDVCELLQNNSKTARISARDHFKSTSIYAYLMWQIWRCVGISRTWDYFSYQQSMAGYHISKIKQYIARNPWFDQIVDHKRTAENVIKYSWKDSPNQFFIIEPHGMLAFKRGLHNYGAVVDDPFQDPENKLLLTKIKKINDIFVTQIMDIPSHELHVVGTAQTNYDFFFDEKIMSRFKVMKMPAVTTERAPETWTDDDVLWPEHMNAEELRNRLLERGIKIFNQEYRCSPAYAEDSFFKQDQLNKVINSELPQYGMGRPFETQNTVIGGWDLGKKSHPSHIAIFEIVKVDVEIEGKIQKKDKYIQRFQMFMDGWEYTRQLQFVRELIEMFKVDKMYYDNTRGELESSFEQGVLPSQLIPVVFSMKTKSSMATEFSKSVESGLIELIDDQRMIEQILSVTNDLQAQEGPNGHGDSFWSVALCFQYKTQYSFTFA